MINKAKRKIRKDIAIGNTLKSLRLQNGFSIRSLSAMLTEFSYPTSIKTLYKWESNKVMPDIKSLNILAKIYNVGLECFFGSEFPNQALNDNELKLISYLHSYKTFKKMVFLLARIGKEKFDYGN